MTRIAFLDTFLLDNKHIFQMYHITNTFYMHYY